MTWWPNLPKVGDMVSADQWAATLAGVKAARDVYMPVTGTVIAVSEDLNSSPDLVHSDLNGAGWLFRLQAADQSELDRLLDAAALKPPGPRGFRTRPPAQRAGHRLPVVIRTPTTEGRLARTRAIRPVGRVSVTTSVTVRMNGTACAWPTPARMATRAMNYSRSRGMPPWTVNLGAGRFTR